MPEQPPLQPRNREPGAGSGRIMVSPGATGTTQLCLQSVVTDRASQTRTVPLPAIAMESPMAAGGTSTVRNKAPTAASASATKRHSPPPEHAPVHPANPAPGPAALVSTTEA